MSLDLAASGADRLAVTVVVCAYTARRWDSTRAALESALAQSPPPAQVLLVIDHNAELADRARRALRGASQGASRGAWQGAPDGVPHGVEVLESDGPPGLSGARNTGLKAATQPVTVFLDDDAEARPGWLAALVEPYRSGSIVATGGNVAPRWPGTRPAWLPTEFDWVVGCSYTGLPAGGGPVRNPIGANMSMQTQLALKAGGFDESVGRVGTRPTGCEETELSIRLTAEQPGSVIYYVPDATVDHQVTPERIKLSYFLRRCWHEGLSKASVVRLAGASAGLERERRQVAVVIPMSIARELGRLLGGDAGALLRVGATVTGLAATASGYLAGRVRYGIGVTAAKPRNLGQSGEDAGKVTHVTHV